MLNKGIMFSSRNMVEKLRTMLHKVIGIFKRSKEEAEKEEQTERIFRRVMELGTITKGSEVREIGSLAAFNLGFILQRGGKGEEAAESWRTATSLGRLSDTELGKDTGQRAL